jgi:hypothetical protein
VDDSCDTGTLNPRHFQPQLELHSFLKPGARPGKNVVTTVMAVGGAVRAHGSGFPYSPGHWAPGNEDVELSSPRCSRPAVVHPNTPWTPGRARPNGCCSCGACRHAIVPGNGGGRFGCSALNSPVTDCSASCRLGAYTINDLFARAPGVPEPLSVATHAMQFAFGSCNINSCCKVA